MSTLLVGILESFLGEHRKFNEDAGQIAFDCPACSEERGLPNGDGKGNLEINYNRSIFKCWSCYETNHMHGPILKLLKKYGTPKIIRDYLLVKPDASEVFVKEKKEIVVNLPEGYTKLSECSQKEYKFTQAMHYLSERGIKDDIIREYDIGFTTKGPFFNRIIIPSYDSDGVLNYFIARWFDKKYNKLKYINPEAEKQEIIFNEGKVNWDATIYLVEGVTDHIVIPNSIPLLGKVISQKLLDMLHDKALGYIVIILDGDAIEDAKKLYKQLNFGNLRDRIRICTPPDGHDPSTIYQLLNKGGIIKLLKSAKKINTWEF